MSLGQRKRRLGQGESGRRQRRERTRYMIEG